MSTATEAAKRLAVVADTLRDRDADYKASDLLYAEVMRLLHPGGVSLRSEHDHHRFHIWMLMIIKVTRYARNWEEGGHLDSLTDLAAYAAMLAAIDSDASGGRAAEVGS